MEECSLYLVVLARSYLSWPFQLLQPALLKVNAFWAAGAHSAGLPVGVPQMLQIQLQGDPFGPRLPHPHPTTSCLCLGPLPGGQIF